MKSLLHLYCLSHSQVVCFAICHLIGTNKKCCGIRNKDDYCCNIGSKPFIDCPVDIKKLQDMVWLVDTDFEKRYGRFSFDLNTIKTKEKVAYIPFVYKENPIKLVELVDKTFLTYDKRISYLKPFSFEMCSIISPIQRKLDFEYPEVLYKEDGFYVDEYSLNLPRSII